MYTYKYTPGEYLKQKEARLSAIFRSLKNTSASLGERWKAEADLRETMTHEFAWAIPNREAVGTLANEKRVVEVGGRERLLGCVCKEVRMRHRLHRSFPVGDSPPRSPSRRFFRRRGVRRQDAVPVLAPL